LASDALSLTNVHAFYGDSHILHGVSFSLQPGGVLALLGRNAAVKTTCISTIIGFLTPRGGELRLFGESIDGLIPERISHLGIGLVPQGRRIFSSLTARENLIVAQQREATTAQPWNVERIYAMFPLLRERHAQVCLQLAVEAESQLYGPQQVTWMIRLDRESDNIGAAIESAIESQDVTAALRLTSAPLYYWTVRGRLSEAQQQLRRALSLAGAQERSAARAQALNAEGYFLWMLRRIPEARQLLDEALAIGCELNDQRVMASALRALSLGAAYEGEYDEARAFVEQALTISRELHDMHGYGWAWVILGDLNLRQGDDERAQQAYEEGVTWLRQAGNHDLLAYPLRRVGYLALRQGDIAQARALCRESMLLNKETNDNGGVVACLAEWARIEAAQGRAADGARLFGAVDAFLSAINSTLALTDQAEYECTLKSLRTELGNSAFEQAWAAGTGMSLDEAAQLVLDGRDGASDDAS